MSKILILMSGGVDSSVVATLLKKQEHELFGATMTLLGKNMVAKMPEIQDAGCYSYNIKSDVEVAHKLAQKLKIPFEIIDCSKIFEKIVLNNFKSEYKSGKTPNPCIICNRYVKFGFFLDELNKKFDFDFVATGHYANIDFENGRYKLKKGINTKKDQSYFLYRLTQEQLSKIKFPLGGLTKEQTRNLAKKFGLETSEKPDSQDFYHGDYNDILGFSPKIGNFITKDGNILGEHNGFWNYTIGQRKGIGLSASNPLYVLDINPTTNEVTVGFKDETFKKKLIATDINWVSIEPQTNNFQAKAKIRSAQKEIDVFVKPVADNKLKVEFEEEQSAITLGQSIVLYDKDCVLAGGFISEVL